MKEISLGRWRLEPTREEVAFHEAGHVIAGLIAGIPIRGVDMRPHARHLAIVHSEDILGSAILGGGIPARIGTPGGHFAICRIRFCLAGPAAESLFARKRGLPYYGDGDDVDTALRYAATLIPDVEVSARERATELIVGRQWRPTRRLLRAHWPQVSALAHLLVGRDEVDEHEIREALKPLPPLPCQRLPRGFRAGLEELSNEAIAEAICDFDGLDDPAARIPIEELDHMMHIIG